METLTSEYRETLIETARHYLKNSYSPYSNYPVGGGSAGGGWTGIWGDEH